MSFKEWYEDADMPEYVDGQWVDMETGLPYVPAQAKKARAAGVSAKAMDFRAQAKLFGGKALTGSAKQKEWGEKIRAEKLGGMTPEQAELVCDPAGLTRSAHFWIQNRAATGASIAEFETTRRGLLKQARALKARGAAAEYAAVAAEYNALTARWGFE
ncbi:MAG: hypothetical protein P9E67_04895 [Candidatus Competibacter sp.]|nr:hypothetical protein [Candidatus Competibacter sp.]